MRTKNERSLYSRVFLTNGIVLTTAVLVLIVAPFSVSRRITVSQIVVLAVALAVMLMANAVMLRPSVAAIDRVLREMATVELLGPGGRLVQPRSNPGARLVRSFNAMLDRLELEQSTSNARALAAQEAERHRIGQELHDEVGQALTVVLLGLKRLEQRVQPELAGEVVLIRESAREGLDDVRRVARELRPGVLEDLGLVSALAALTKDFAWHGSTSVERSFARELPALPPDVELVVYRVAQEALTNAHRHGNPRHVGVSLSRERDDVVLEVADDGRGSSRIVAGSGVRGMRERALIVGGQLQITSSEGGGTVVRLSVPVADR